MLPLPKLWRAGRARRGVCVPLLASALLVGAVPSLPAGAAPIPSFSVNDPRAVEGDSGTRALRFTILLTPAAPVDVSVDFHAVNGTAVAPDDFEPAAGTVVFAAGEISRTVDVTIEGDRHDEPDEELSLVLSGESAGTAISDDTGSGTILDDDVAPQLSIDDVIISKDSGRREAELSVRLFPTSSQLVTVEFATRNGEAFAPADYGHHAGILEFSPGDGTQRIRVPVNGDDIQEPDETFTVELFNASGATIADAVGQVLITDNDVTPQLSIDDVEILEGDGGTRDAVFTVTRFPHSDDDVTVEYATANDSATAPADYEHAAGLLTFDEGETSKTVVVKVKGDDLEELIFDPEDEPVAEEIFTVELANPTGGANLADSSGQGRILDDDVTVQVSVDDVEVVEGDSGSRDAVFTLKRFPDTADRVTVEYFTESDTATAPDDYQHVAGVAVFDRGETRKTVTVKIKGDEIDEYMIDDADEIRTHEIFLLVLANPSANARVADEEGEGKILDDDILTHISVGDATVKETDSGATDMTFTVTASPTPDVEAWVSYTTVDGEATAFEDYRPKSGILRFGPGERTRTITVPVLGDTAGEEDETLSLVLVDPGRAVLADDSATGTIADDDLDPALSVSDTTVTETDEQTLATFVVRLSEEASAPVSFTVATEDDTATSPTDYTGTGATLTIAPGERRLKVEVPIAGDRLEEDDETLALVLSEASGAFLADPRGVAVIVDDDRPGAPRVGMAATSTGEGYWLAAADGDVFAFGDADFAGSVPLHDSTYSTAALNRPIVDIERTANDRGYWLVASDGGVFTFGNARFLGSTGDIRLNQPIVGMAATPRGSGYWLVAADGGVFTFGDAGFHGSTGGMRLNRPIVGMVPTPSGKGYWLVATDGGVFAFGDAGFHGSTGHVRLNRPIVGAASTASGLGYHLIASDGGVFTFGDAAFHGSTGAVRLNQPITGMAATPSGQGYWLSAVDGGIFAFGDAAFHGSTGGSAIRPGTGN